MTRKIILFIFSLLLIAICANTVSFGQTSIGTPNTTVPVKGGLSIDSLLKLPIVKMSQRWKNKWGKDTIAMLYIDSATRKMMYMKNGISGRVQTWVDSNSTGGYIAFTSEGVANGVATLDNTGKVPSGQLPTITISGQVYVDSSMAQMLGHGSATVGAISIRIDSSNNLYVLVSLPSSTRGNWHISTAAAENLQEITDIGAITTHTITVSGIKITNIANGSGSDSVVTEVAGVLKKIAQSQLTPTVPVPTMQQVNDAGNYIDEDPTVWVDNNDTVLISPYEGVFSDGSGNRTRVAYDGVRSTDGFAFSQMGEGVFAIGNITGAQTSWQTFATTTRAFFTPDKDITAAGLEDTARYSVLCSNFKADSIAKSLTLSNTGTFIREVVLTSTTTATYTPSTGCTKIVMRAWGAGGGGGGAKGTITQCGAAGGGGSGAYFEKTLTVSHLVGYSYICGTGGTGGVGATPTDGNPGTATTFTVSATVYSAPGGSGGEKKIAVAGVSTASGGLKGSIATNGDVNFAGSPGSPGICVGALNGIAGIGGGIGGGLGAEGSSNGGDATGYCAGGAGGMVLTATNSNGGHGANGVIIIWEYR